MRSPHTEKLLLKRVARILGGGTPPSNPEFWGGGNPFATPKDLRLVNGGQLQITERTLTHAGVASGSTIAPKSSVLLSIRAPIGYTALLDGEAAFSQGCKAVVPDKEKLSAKFLQYALTAQLPILEISANGTTFQELSAVALGEVPIDVPKANEQDRIVRFLDAEIAKIDHLIAKQEELIRLTEERTEANIESLVWGQRITRESDEVASDRSYRPRAVVSLALTDRLTSIPNSWDIRRFKWVFERRVERNLDLTLEMLSLRQTGAVVPRSETGQNQEPSEDSLPKYLVVSPGNLVLNPMWLTGGAIGVSERSGAVSPDYRVFTVGKELIPAYAHEVLRSICYRRQFKLFERASTTFDRRIQQADLDNLAVPIPPIEDQEQIVCAVMKIHDRAQQLVYTIKNHIELLRNRRSALITAAVTGQIEI